MKPLMTALETYSSLHLSETEVELMIYPENEGVMAPVTKTPELRVSKLDVVVTPYPFHADTQADIEVSIPSSALKVIPKDIPASDRARIELLIREKLLGIQAHPVITFRATVSGRVFEDSTALIAGVLRIRDQEKRIEFAAKSLTDGIWTAETSLRQTDFGIKPASAFMGALRSCDDVKIKIRLDLSSILKRGLT